MDLFTRSRRQPRTSQRKVGSPKNQTTQSGATINDAVDHATGDAEAFGDVFRSRPRQQGPGNGDARDTYTYPELRTREPNTVRISEPRVGGGARIRPGIQESPSGNPMRIEVRDGNQWRPPKDDQEAQDIMRDMVLDGQGQSDLLGGGERSRFGGSTGRESGAREVEERQSLEGDAAWQQGYSSQRFSDISQVKFDMFMDELPGSYGQKADYRDEFKRLLMESDEKALEYANNILGRAR